VTDHHPVVIVGGGQAGLAVSHRLAARGIAHLVLEKHRVAHEWRERRWDSFCLVTPNWQCQLPGFPYRGPDPHGFMKKDEIVAYLEDYVRSFQPPLREGVAVTALRPRPQGGFALATSQGDCTADQVVVATGGYHQPAIPRCAERLPARLRQLHSSEYRNPQALPPGEVLVVGTGQSGCQIAEDLHLAGRRVHLCVGSAPRTARRYRGKDVVDWLDEMGHYRLPVDQHPMRQGVRDRSNHYVTGRDGGRDIDLRQRALEGMVLAGRLTAVHGETLEVAGDLAQNLDRADAVAESIKNSIDQYIEAQRISAPVEPRPVPVWEPTRPASTIDLSPISAVIWSTGYRADYCWIELPLFDGRGYPCHLRGITPVAGAYFIGLPWLHTWGSGRFSAVGEDAEWLAAAIAARSS
jgi:putative flavoprotein involved in K+ transport